LSGRRRRLAERAARVDAEGDDDMVNGLEKAGLSLP
jgi:hypothetical protein